MQIPIRVDYGVRALVDLATHASEGPVRASDIARRNAIPEPFLEQLLNALAKHGLTRSQRGPQGGHMLAMDPADITLSMAMTALGEPQTVSECLHDEERCRLAGACAQRDVWRSVEEAVQAILNRTTIADLAERSRTRIPLTVTLGPSKVSEPA
jgi:Rrf2 family protein